MLEVGHKAQARHWTCRRKVKKPYPYIAVDLFAGAGGLSLGAEMAGVRMAFATDVWTIAAETYQTNLPHVVFHTGPVEELGAQTVLSAIRREKGDIDILLGGPPCQGFSIYAPVRRADDRRNALILDYLRLVEGLMPKYLVMENVPGLLSLGGGSALDAVYQQLRRLGYSVAHRVLLAAWYGVPQERWRLVILGWRNDMPPAAFPAPRHWVEPRANFTGGRGWIRAALGDLNGRPDFLPGPVTVGDAISDLPPLGNGEGKDEVPMPHRDLSSLTPYQKWARAGAVWLRHHVAPKLSQINLERLRYVKPGGSWRDIPFDLLPEGMKRARKSDHTKRYGRMEFEGLACTILTKCDPHWGSFFHYDQDRAITPREAARLQSFPDRYVFAGPMAAKYTQIGNAVPPLLAKALVEEICLALAQTQGQSMSDRACLTG